MAYQEAAVVDQLADFVAELHFEDLSEDTVHTVERAFVDTVGVALAGLEEPAGEKACAAFGTTAALFSDVRSANERALAIGTASHALDYDDLSWSMDGHPSVTLVPPLLAVIPETVASGRDIITAFVAGYETECAIAYPVIPTHYKSGWHATATFGVFGATAAVAKLLDLGRTEMREAIAIAASMASGTKENFGSMTKPLHAGLAARSGVTASKLAANGFTGGDSAFEGDAGFWALYADGPEAEFSIGDGLQLEQYGLQLKAYPCCYFTHASIAATEELQENHSIDPNDIDTVEVLTSAAADDALQYDNPDVPSEGKFSMPYVIASTLVTGRVTLSTFEPEHFGNEAVREMMDRVEFIVDENLPYNANSGTVRITTANGTYEKHRKYPPGTYHDPLSKAELHEKFYECTERVIPQETADAVYEQLVSLSEHSSVTGLAIESTGCVESLGDDGIGR
ncbi:MmgE/PrpD family protein [Halostagnicola kamekurae]|uniref:2-methylcitrate dehydratase PrpD n=1 Tax=Halostagnicola kamekurae TaxID=619731 RepID=A0A1I6UNS6_9EURY|nr:MmgE/PrpD family protein [Halostagnicola kamekurae]SFT03109.1 2-methylcitrate dehydratase PrpD [Halostagnicola kamekurae]